MKIGKIPGHWQSLGQGRTKLGGDLGKLSRRKESQLEVVFETKNKEFFACSEKDSIRFKEASIQFNLFWRKAEKKFRGRIEKEIPMTNWKGDAN